MSASTVLLIESSGQLLALPHSQVREVIRAGLVTRLPRAPFGCLGTINLRGELVPVLALATLVGLARPPRGEALEQALVRGHLVVCTFNESLFGLLVDRVLDLKEGQIDALEAGASVLGPRSSELTKKFSKKPGFWSSNSYDAAMTLMLASVHALQANNVAKVADLTGAQIRDSMFKINDPAGEIILTGADEFAKAVNFIKAGTAINYQGPSGPMNFDANGNVNGRVARFKFQNGSFEDVETYDCVANRATCPLVR